MSEHPFKRNDAVYIDAPNHREHGKYGTVTSDEPGKFLGTYMVTVSGVGYAFQPHELRLMTKAEHYENYRRYKAQQDALPQPFTSSQQSTPLQYLPYARYPITN